MASLVQKIKSFISSPQGQRMIEQGRRELSKPENQQKLRQLMARFKGGKRH